MLESEIRDSENSSNRDRKRRTGAGAGAAETMRAEATTATVAAENFTMMRTEELLKQVCVRRKDELKEILLQLEAT